MGSFQAFSSATGGSGGGGMVPGLTRRLLRLFPDVLSVGRAHALRCLSQDGAGVLVVVSTHLETAATLGAKRPILESIAALGRREGQCMLLVF